MDQENLHELLQVRRQKLEQLKEKGIDPYAPKYRADHYSKDIIEHFESLEGQEVSWRFGGYTRSRSQRCLQDYKGRIQIYLRLDNWGRKILLFSLCDLGDFIGCRGLSFAPVKVSYRQCSIIAFWLNLRPLRKNGTA